MNKQSSYRVVDVLTTDTRSMSCEIGGLIENVERKCFTIRSVSQSITTCRCKTLRDMRICHIRISLLSYMLLVIFMYNHITH